MNCCKKWLDIISNNPYNDFLLTVMSGLSQLERDLISQRTREGLESAKAGMETNTE